MSDRRIALDSGSRDAADPSNHSPAAEPNVSARSTSQPKHIVVTIHGIRTFGQWQERFAERVHAVSPETTVFNYKYGYFSVLGFLVPMFRWIVTLRFRRALCEMVARYPGATIDVVAHSFGTHLIGHALRGARQRPSVDTLVLAGSVLKSNFDWGFLINRHQVKRVVNECGTKDTVLIWNQLLVLFTGMAGRIGFAGLTGTVLTNNYYAFGHGGYFATHWRGNRDFMAERWLPLLTGAREVPSNDERSATLLQNVATGFIQNAEPIKLALWILPLLLGLWWVDGQRRAAITQRDRALAGQLAMQADLLRSAPGNLDDVATLLVVESLRIAPLAQADRVARALLAMPARRATITDPRLNARALVFPKGMPTLVVWTMADERVTYDRDTGKEMARESGHGLSTTAAFSTDGNQMAYSAGLDGVVSLSRGGTSRSLLHLARGEMVLSVSLAGDASYAAAATSKGEVLISRTSDGGLVRRLAYGGSLHDAFVSANGKVIATAGFDGVARVIDVSSGRQLQAIHMTSAVMCVTLDQSGQRLAIGGRDGLLEIHDLVDSRLVWTLKASGTLTKVSFSPTGKYLALGTATGHTAVFEIGKATAVLEARSAKAVVATAFGDDDRSFATADEDSIQLYSLGAVESTWQRPGLSKSVAALSEDGSFVAASTGHHVEVLRTRDQAEAMSGDTRADVQSLAFDRTGRYLALGEFFGGLEVIDLRAEKEGFYAPRNSDRPQPIAGVAFTSDSQLVAAVHLDGMTRLFDSRSGQLIRTIAAEPPSEALAFSLDNRYVAVGSLNRIQEFEVATGRAVPVEPPSNVDVQSAYVTLAVTASVTFTRSPPFIIIGTTAGQQLALSGPTWRPVWRYDHHAGVSAQVLDRSGRVFASGTSTGMIRLVAFPSMNEIARFEDRGPVLALAFDASGRYLVSVTGSERELSVARHLVNVEDLINESCSRVSRNLTAEEWAEYIGGPYHATCSR